MIDIESMEPFISKKIIPSMEAEKLVSGAAGSEAEKLAEIVKEKIVEPIIENVYDPLTGLLTKYVYDPLTNELLDIIETPLAEIRAWRESQLTQLSALAEDFYDPVLDATLEEITNAVHEK